jgi:hypothetical protein
VLSMGAERSSSNGRGMRHIGDSFAAFATRSTSAATVAT